MTKTTIVKEVELFKDFPDLLNFKDLKTLLGKGRNTVYKLLQTGTIPSIKIGRDYKILKTDVIDYIYKNQYTTYKISGIDNKN